MVMVGIMNENYGIDIGFFDWMLMGVPFAIVMLLICHFVLVKVFYPNNLGQLQTSKTVIDSELKKLGPIKKSEKVVLIIFLCTAILWMIRSTLDDYFPITDTGISLLAALALFSFPLDFKNGKFPLAWEDTVKLPWGILILFGGGLALASGMKISGIIDLIGTSISENKELSVFLVTSILIFVMLFMTELMSNVALVNILIPVVGGIAVGLGVSVLSIVIPVTLAASCAFMLPMATPPNAIVFASGHIKVFEMAKAGIVLNIISILLLLGLTYFVIPLLF